MYLRHSSSGGKSVCSSVISLSPTVFTDVSSEGNITAVHLNTVWTPAACINSLAADLTGNTLALILTHFKNILFTWKLLVWLYSTQLYYAWPLENTNQLQCSPASAKALHEKKCKLGRGEEVLMLYKSMFYQSVKSEPAPCRMGWYGPFSHPSSNALFVCLYSLLVDAEAMNKSPVCVTIYFNPFYS